MHHDLGLAWFFRRRAGWALSAAALCAACSNSRNHSSALGEGGDTGSPSGTVSCVDDARLDPGGAESEKSGLNSVLRFRLEKTEPAPPSKGDNTFTVSTRDEAGEPFAGELSVKARMPDHGHESPTLPTVSFDPDSATYTVTPLNLFMAGVWQVTFTGFAGSADTGPALDSASFYFCIQG